MNAEYGFQGYGAKVFAALHSEDLTATFLKQNYHFDLGFFKSVHNT
jgi:hypothetical protein